MTNNLGITKAEGMAALRGMESIAEQEFCDSIFWDAPGTHSALIALGWGCDDDNRFNMADGDYQLDQVLMALAWVATIGGAVDGRGMPCD